MKILGKGIDRVKLITRDNLEGIIQSILIKRIFGDRGELELLDNFGELEDLINSDRDSLQPVKSLLISGLKIKNQDKLEETCRNRRVRFKYFLNEYRKNLSDSSKYLNSESLGDFVDYFSKFNSSKLILKDYESLIDLFSDNFSEKKFDLIKLLGILGKRRFIERFSKDNSLEFSEDEKSLIILESERIERILLALIYSSEICKLSDYKTKISFTSPSFYSEYFLREILRRDSSVELAILFEFPKFIRLMFRDKNKSINLIKGDSKVEGMIGKNILSFGLKKTIFELMKFYGEKITFI